MSRTDLTALRIGTLKPRKVAYDARDRKLRGFGLRVLPSGRKHFFVHCQHRGERVWKIVGDASAMDVREARSRAVEVLAAIRLGEDPPRDPEETLFEAVAEVAFLQTRTPLKAGNPLCQPALSREPASAPFRRAPDRRYRPEGRCQLVRLAVRHPVAADRSMPVFCSSVRWSTCSR